MSDPNLITARSTAHPTHTEWFLTGTPAAAKAGPAEAKAVFAQAATLLAEKNIQVMQEKVYGLRPQREALLSARREEYARRDLDTRVPVTFLEGPPAQGGSFAGLQIWGASPKKSGEKLITTIEKNGAAIGRRWTGEDYKLLHFAAIDGRGPDGALRDCPSCQAQQMFDNVAAALAEHQLTFKDVPRTWIYLSRILDWYGEFNKVRNKHYGRVGLSASEGSIFPASTGIQARSDQEECLMDVLAVELGKKSSLKVVPVIKTPRQDKAFSYGSAFSRAVVLESDGHKTVFISGTASINAAGATTHLGEREAQCLDTLIAIAAILEDQGGGLEHLCQATVFCKDLAVFDAYQSATRRLRVPKIPGVPLIADVCRDNLLVEIEAVAMI
ncbi:MAG: RidA family protein [Myxococcales bacterium]